VPWIVKTGDVTFANSPSVRLSAFIDGIRLPIQYFMKFRSFGRSQRPQSIRAALRAENAAWCDPPLSSDEVDRIVNSVMRYPPGNTDSEAQGNPSMTDLETNKATALRLVEVFNGRRLDLLEDVLHPECRGRGISAFPPVDPEVGPGGQRKLYEMFYQASPTREPRC
jgi:hypothetical protein